MAGNGTREPQRIIGRYALFDQIGAGGMATVHFGRLLGPAGFSKTVAIKRLHPHFARDPEFSAMFLDEARLAARVQHPNVVATLDVVARDGELFLVMEYVEGLSLAGVFWESVRTDKKIPVGIVGAIMVNLLSGLHAAHEATNEQGHPLALIHRDVSPQNVIVGRDGVARVLDFGIAKAIGRSQTTREGRIKGKLAYMPPEQIRAQPLDRRVDIYAASVVMWELLTMRRLFDEDDDATTVWRAVHEDPPTPSSIVTGLPVGVDELVMRGLAKKASDRFATAREMALAIEKLLGVESTLSVGDFVATCGLDALQKMASKVREIESISEELHTTDILHDDEAPRAGRDSRDEPITVDGPTALRDLPLPELPALDVPSIGSNRAQALRNAEAPMPLELDFERARAAPPSVGPSSHQGVPSDSGRGLRSTQAYPFSPGAIERRSEMMLGGHPIAPTGSPPSESPASPSGFTAQRPPLSVSTPPVSSHPASTQARSSGAEHAQPVLPQPLSAQASPASFQPGFQEPHDQPISMELADDPRSSAVSNRAPPAGLPPRYAPPASQPQPRPQIQLQPKRMPQRAPTPASTSGIPVIAGAVLAIALLGAGGFILFGRGKPSAGSSANRGAPPSGGVERACEASRQQIKNGASLSPVDTYGWVVELWLARDDGAPLSPTDLSLAHFRAPDGTLDPAMGVKLLPQDRGEVTLVELPSPPPFEGKEAGVVIRMAGGYAASFFAADTRPRFLKLADAAFDESKASVGALYARCGHLPYHDIGVWFRGRDPQTVADAIGFQIGAYAEAPWVARSVYTPVGNDGTGLQSYRQKRVAVDSQLFGDEVRLLAGEEEDSKARGTTVIFPLASPLRSMSMARWVTKQSNLD